MATINVLLLGMIATSYFIAALFFLRFWKLTRDRLFIFFAFSFFLEGCCRVTLGLGAYSEESEPLIYLLRLLSYLIILFAIVDKNTKGNPIK